LNVLSKQRISMLLLSYWHGSIWGVHTSLLPVIMTLYQLTQIPSCSFFSKSTSSSSSVRFSVVIGFLMISIRTQSKQNDGVAGIQLILFLIGKLWLRFYYQNKFHLRIESFWNYQFNEISCVVINVFWDNMWRTCLFVQIKRCLLVERAKTIVFPDCKRTTCCVFRLLSCLKYIRCRPWYTFMSLEQHQHIFYKWP